MRLSELGGKVGPERRRRQKGVSELTQDEPELAKVVYILPKQGLHSDNEIGKNADG